MTDVNTETVRADENLEGQVEKQKGQEQGQTFTKEDFEAKLQSETDRRVTEALKTAEAKWKAQYKEKLQKEKSEAEKLAKMTAQERAQEEFRKEREAFEVEKANLERDKLEVQVRKNLREQGLREDFAPFLMGKSAEDVQENIKAFKDAWDAAVSEAVKEQLKGTPPKSGKSSEAKDIWSEISEKYKR